MSSNSKKAEYVTWRVAPIIRRHIKEIVTKWQNNNDRKTSVSSVVNIVLFNGVDACDKLNDKEIEGALQKYRELMISEGINKR